MKYFQENQKIERDSFYGGTKKEVYKHLKEIFFLETYTHPMITRSYLKHVNDGTFECPPQDALIEKSEHCNFNKRVLFVLLTKTELDFGLEITKMPSKKWLIAALSYAIPNSPAIFLLEIKKNIYTTFYEGESITEQLNSLGELVIMTNNLNKKLKEELKEDWNMLVKDQLIIKMASLIEGYAFLIPSDFINNIIE